MTLPQPPSPALANDMANAIRMLAVDAVEKAKSGHPGAPMGMAEIAEVLRHRSQDSTAIYAKVSFEALRGVARAWPTTGGV